MVEDLLKVNADDYSKDFLAVYTDDYSKDFLAVYTDDFSEDFQHTGMELSLAVLGQIQILTNLS